MANDAIDFVEEAAPDQIDFQADSETPAAAVPPPIKPNAYEQLRLQGIGPGLGATTGPAAPEEVIPFYESLTRPAIPLPRIHAKSTLGKVLAAPVNVAESLIEGAESPVGALTLPALGTQAGRAAMAALGTVQGLQQMSQAQDAGELTEGALLAGTSPLMVSRFRDIVPPSTRPVQGALFSGELLPTPPGAPAPRAELALPPERVSPEIAAQQARRMQQEATAGFEPQPPSRPVVPETPAETRLTAAEEVRANEADTIPKILNLFPSLEGNRAKARVIGKAAWGEKWPEQPAPREVVTHGELVPPSAGPQEPRDLTTAIEERGQPPQEPPPAEPPAPTVPKTPPPAPPAPAAPAAETPEDLQNQLAEETEGGTIPPPAEPPAAEGAKAFDMPERVSRDEYVKRNMAAFPEGTIFPNKLKSTRTFWEEAHKQSIENIIRGRLKGMSVDDVSNAALADYPDLQQLARKKGWLPPDEIRGRGGYKLVDTSIEAKLYSALHSVENAEQRWNERRAKGLTDAELKQALDYEWGMGGGSSVHGGYGYKGGNNPQLEDAAFSRKPLLKGKELLQAVRDLLKIHQPKEAASIPAAPAATKPGSIEATPLAGKTLGEWEAVKDASQLPRGGPRAELARYLAVPNQPSRILQALSNKKRTREIHAPPAAPEAVAPVQPEPPKTATTAMTVTPTELPANTKAFPPNTAFLQVRDYHGNITAIIGLPYDGSPESAREAATKLRPYADQKYEWKSELYWGNSAFGATDASGKLKWVISPNFAHVAEATTKQARYILGDLSAAPERIAPAEPPQLSAPAQPEPTRFPQEEGKGGGWVQSTDWRKSFDQAKDIEEKIDWLRAVANNRGHTATAEELADVLTRTEALLAEQKHSRLANTLWDVSENPAASAETKQRAKNLYDQFYQPEPQPAAQPAAEPEPALTPEPEPASPAEPAAVTEEPKEAPTRTTSNEPKNADERLKQIEEIEAELDAKRGKFKPGEYERLTRQLNDLKDKRRADEFAKYFGEGAVERGPEGSQKITGKMLKAQKADLLAQVDQAIKDAPEKGDEKITISVKGDGDFTLFNTKENLRKFREIAKKEFPADIGKTGTPSIPSGKGHTMPKAVDPDPGDVPKIAAANVSSDETRFVIQTAYADGTQIISTDGRRLLRVVTDKAPGTIADPVRLDEKGQVAKGEGDYPNFNQVIPDSPDLIKGGADSSQLWTLANQAVALWKGADFEKHSPAGQLFINPDGSLGIRTKRPDTGDEYESNVKEGAKNAGRYNVFYLFDAADTARHLGNEKVDLYIDGQTGPLEVRGKNHQELVMPVKLEADATGGRDPLAGFTPGQRAHGSLAKGLGPTRNPEGFISGDVIRSDNKKFTVSLEGGKFTIKQEFPDRKRLEKWDEVATIPSDKFTGSVAARRKVIGEALKGKALSLTVNEIEKAASDRLKTRDRIIKENQARKPTPQPQAPPNQPPIGMGAAVESEFGPGGAGSDIYGIAHRVREARAAAGRTASVPRGKGVSTEETLARGRRLVANGADPEAMLRAFEKSKALSEDLIDVTRYHGEVLDRNARRIEEKFGTASDEYAAAWKALADWDARTKPIQTEWHRAGMAQQGEVDVDTGTFTGLQRAHRQATGKDFTPKQAKEAKEVAGNVSTARGEADRAKADVFESIDKELGAVKAPDVATPEDARKALGKTEGELSPTQIKTIWNYIKNVYLKRGESNLDDIAQAASEDLGLPKRTIMEALAQPKGTRKLTGAMYLKMSRQRQAVQAAKNWLLNAQAPLLVRALQRTPRFFFGLATLGHGTVGLVTHAGSMMFDPRAANHYWPNFLRQFRFVADRAYHERLMQDLQSRPLFPEFKQAGLANDPFRFQDDYQNPNLQSWFGQLGAMGNRGFDALKVLRQDRMEQIWESYPDSLRTPEMARLTALAVNHATGISTAHLGSLTKPAGIAFFAPRLELSRWALAVGDPVRALNIFRKWPEATPEDRMFAIGEVKQKAVIAGTYLSLLALNQAMLSASGSTQKINWTNPKRSDFLAFKGFGRNISVISPLLHMVGLFAQLYHDAAGKRTKFEQLTPRAKALYEDIGAYGRGKLSPFGGPIVDVIAQADFRDRPLPMSDERVPANLRRQGIERYTWPEYVSERFTPIPLSEFIREVWTAQGVPKKTQQEYLQALINAGTMGVTGVRVSPDKQSE